MGSAEESLVLAVWAHFSEKPAGVGGKRPTPFGSLKNAGSGAFLKKKT